MADLVMNIALASVAEKVRDSATVLLVLLLTATEADGTVRDHDELNALLGAAGNTEATFTNYARKTGLTATLTVDDTNDRVDVDIPDQTWSSAGNGSNETMTDLIVAYEESGSDAGRVPLTLHDFVTTTDGSDLAVQFAAAGFFRSECAA